jgi:spore coat protein CotH
LPIPKAESGGDYSYRGDDPAAYEDVFDQEAGEDNADLMPLIEFLEFLNESDDATFAAEIATRLDVDGFATYLAMQTLLDNFDDIDGPGNNSYLCRPAADRALAVSEVGRTSCLSATWRSRRTRSSWTSGWPN